EIGSAQGFFQGPAGIPPPHGRGGEADPAVGRKRAGEERGKVFLGLLRREPPEGGTDRPCDLGRRLGAAFEELLNASIRSGPEGRDAGAKGFSGPPAPPKSRLTKSPAGLFRDAQAVEVGFTPLVELG